MSSAASRAGDALISESVQEHVDLRSGPAPLIFQGGNCLIGDRFWLFGKDYFADSVDLVGGGSPPVDVPAGTTPDAFVTKLFADYVDSKRELIVVGTDRPIPLRTCYGTRDETGFHLDIAGDGAGTFQPVFHIDMFITMVGREGNGDFDVLWGARRSATSCWGRSRRTPSTTSTTRSPPTYGPMG